MSQYRSILFKLTTIVVLTDQERSTAELDEFDELTSA